jgi:outer membrane protein assembly factor BamB
MMRRLALFGLAALLAAGCDKDEDVDPPAELVDVEPAIQVKELWSTRIGDAGEHLRLSLGIAVDGDTLYVASHKGVVHAISAADGRTRWRAETKLALSAGPGGGNGLVALGTSDGDVVALEAADGRPRWKARVSGEVLSAPLVVGDRVVVRTLDGRMRALSASDGRELWLVEELVPRLSLRGAAAPVVSGDVVICGFDTGKLVAVSLATGEALWQAQVSTPSGRTELERLADVDAAVRVSGDDVYAVGYQGRLVMLSLDSGQVWWGRDVSSYRGLALDDDQIYVSAADGAVIALKRRDGSVVWQQDGLHQRGLGTPAVDGSAVVVGDFEGYLHWLDRDTGRFVARERPGDTPIRTPVVGSGRLYALDVDGTLVAYTSSGAGAAAGGV